MSDSSSDLLPNTVPINRLPTDVFVRIPRFFKEGKEWTQLSRFPMNKPLITMTHVCQSWRNVLISHPGLWTQVDFYKTTQSQQEAFLSRSGKQLLDIHLFLDDTEKTTGTHMSITYDNLFRLRRIWITSTVYLDQFLVTLSSAAPELKQLEMVNGTTTSELDKIFPKISGGRMAKLTNFALCGIDTDFLSFDFPSLTRFSLLTGIEIPVQDLTSLFERCPLLEFADIDLRYRQSTPPPHKRVYLANLQGLRLCGAACTGLLDHLILPVCTTITMWNIETTVASPRIHPSSFGHLPITRGITKAVAFPNLCVYFGPNGIFRFCPPRSFDADYFASFSPISVSHIRELVVGEFLVFDSTPDGVCGAFKVLTEVEDLTIRTYTTEPFFTTLGTTMDGGILLPGLRRLTVYVMFGGLDVPSLIRCAKVRKEHSRLLEEVTLVWERDPKAGVVEEVESLREFVGELTQCPGTAREMPWRLEDVN